jgi:integrase
MGLGYMTPETAEEERAKQEAALRLGLERPSSPPPSYTAADLLMDYVAAIEDSPTSDAHKDRVAGDAIGLARHLGQIVADELNAHHVGRYLALRSRERVVRARRHRDESDEDWIARMRAALVDPAGKPVASRTIRNEVETLRRAMRWGRDAGKIAAQPIPLPHRKSLPKDERPARKVTESEVRRIVVAAGELGHRDLVEMLAWSGRRPIAIFGLRVMDCARVMDDDLPRNERRAWYEQDKADEGVGWGRLTDPAYDAIRRRVRALGDVSPETLLWSRPHGGAWSSEDWPKTFARIARLAKVPNVVTYDLRKHACAQILAAVGNPKVAIEYTGHRTVEMLLTRYAYVLGERSAGIRIGWTPEPLRLASGGHLGGQGPGDESGDA